MLEACSDKNFDEWTRLRKCLYPDSEMNQLVEEAKAFLLEPDKYCQYLARNSDGKAIAFVEASIRTDYVNGTSGSPVAYLESIFVAEDHRREGIAKRMIDAIVMWAKTKSVNEIASDADLSNTASQAMHKALGFQETERVVYFKRNIK